MKKIISFVGLFAVLGVGIGDAHGVAMSAQVRRLLQEKQEKIEQLEKCEGKKQGWMIAGISTIGLTAVGVGVNIAQASKSNRLSSEIEMEKTTLQRQQDELGRISNQIADERAKQAQQNGGGNGQSGGSGGSSVSTPAGGEMIEPFCCTVVDDSNVPMSDFIGIIGCDDDANTTSSTDASGQFCFDKSMLSTAKCFIGGWQEDIEYGMFHSSIGELKRHCVDGNQKIMLCNTDSVPVQKLGQDCSGGTADGVIGESCDDGKGVWFTAIKGNNKKCSNSAGKIVDCKCVENVTPTPGQGSGGGDKPVENPKASETNGRVVGGACIDEDIKKLSPYGWVSGTYIQVTEKANSSTVLKARCKNAKGDVVPCNCKAIECDGDRGFDPTPDKNGLCVKKKAEQKPAAKPKENPTEKPAEEQQEKPKESPKQTTSDSLDASIDGEGLCYYDIDGDSKYTGGCSVSNPGDWGVVFPDYTVYGTAVCNRNPGIPIGDMTNRGGTNCWCKMIYPKESRWVYIGNAGVAKNRKKSCANSCSVACAADVKSEEHVRNKLFNSAK